MGSSSAPGSQSPDAGLAEHGGLAVSGEGSQHGRTRTSVATDWRIADRPHDTESHDIYLSNPEVLTRLTHAPWPVETENTVRLLMRQVTEPPRIGLLQKIDVGSDLQMYMEDASSQVRGRWERLLSCYDVAMMGRNLALSVLVDASSRFYEAEELEQQSQEQMRALAKKNEDLEMAIKYVESQNQHQQKQIAKLKERNRTLAKEGVARHAEYNKALRRLEDMLAAWEETLGVPITRPTTAGPGGDPLEDICHGLNEVYVASRTRNAHYRQLQDKYDALVQETAERSRGRPSREISPSPMSDPGSEPTAREGEDDAAGNDPEEGRAHPDSPTASQGGSQAARHHQDEENDRLREEIAFWRSKCADLECTIDQLEQRLAIPGLEVAYAEKSERASLGTIEDSRRFLSSAAFRPLADELGTGLLSQSTQPSLPSLPQSTQPSLSSPPPLPSLPQSTQPSLLHGDVVGDIETSQSQIMHPSQHSRSSLLHGDVIRDMETSQSQSMPPGQHSWPSLLPRDLIREIEAAQLQTIQSTQGVMDEIKAAIDELVGRVSTEMAQAKELHRLEARQILEDLQKLSLSADAWSREHQKLEENHGLLRDELDALQRAVRLNEQQQQRSASERRNGPQPVSAVIPRSTSSSASSSYEPSVVLSFDASTHEMLYLHLVRLLIQKMRAPPSQNQMGPDTAVPKWLNHLYCLQHELNSVDPNTPTENLMAKFGTELKMLLSYGIEKNPRPYYSTVEYYDKLFHSLQELGSYVPKPPGSERQLLKKIRDGISAAEQAQETHERLEQEHEAWRAQHPRLPLSAGQLAEVLRLAGGFLEAAGSDWNQDSPETRESAAAMEELLGQIQEVMADQYLLERRRALRDGIKKQGDQLAELREGIPAIGARVDDMMEQMAAFDRLQLRGYTGTTRDARRVDMTFRAGLKRHEMRLRREQQASQARCDELEAGRARFQEFLDQQALADRRLAEHVLTQALLRLQSAGAPGQHGSAACFCTLLRHYLPRAYYSAITGGCCAGGRQMQIAMSSSSAHESERGAWCHGHHGHGVLASPGQLWTSLCHVLTSLTWLLFLLLTQPHRVRQTASFVLSSLLAVPIYLYRLIAHAVLRLRLRLRRPLGGPSPPPPLPRLALPTVPPASTLVGAALALLGLYGWLAYVAVAVERRIWLGNNGGLRFAYALDVGAAGRGGCGCGGACRSPYPAWSPLQVDFRLAAHPAWAWFENRVHSLWSWDRRVVL
ncbi:hypothetical protein VTH06DRAFT_8544 [Thermothelomyces fergusii]